MELISKLTVTGAANINIGFNPYTFYTQNNNYMKIELAHDFLANNGYLFKTPTNWFSFESTIWGCGFNIAGTTGLIGDNGLPNVRTTNATENPITVIFDNGTANGFQGEYTQTNTFTGNMPNDTVIFYYTSSSTGYSGELYGFKVYGYGDVLAHHYVGFDDGVNVGIMDLVTNQKYTPTGSNYTIECVEYAPPTPTSNSKIYLGDNNLGAGKIKLGSNNVSAIYLGVNLIFPTPTPPTPTITYVQSITEDNDCTDWGVSKCIDTGIAHNSTTMTVRVKYSSKCDFCDRIVGYLPDDPQCIGDSNDFRIFSYEGGTFDYSSYRDSNIGCYDESALGTYYDVTMGDNFVYDNVNETYLCQGFTVGTIPSQGCHIFADVAGINLYEVIIEDNGTTLFDGIAAYDSDGHIGIYDTISDTLIYNPDLTMTYTPIPTPPSVNDFVCFTALEAGAEVSLQKGSNLSTYPVYLYASTDNGQTFARMENNQSFSMPNIGDKVYIYGNNTAIGRATGKYYSLIVNNKNVSISGDLTRLLNPNGVTTLPDFALIKVFQNSNGIVDASGLTIPVTTVGQHSLDGLFAGCTTLQYAPTQLGATNLGDYCYANMFKNCTSLLTAPTLSATTLAEYCYQEMFSHCTSLTTAPALTALTMENYCYSQMFEYCSGLTTAPVLPALTLDTDCYNCLFRNCTSLNSVTCLATDISALDCTDSWLENVSSTGTFTKNPNMSNWPTGIDGIPTGWTVVDAQ